MTAEIFVGLIPYILSAGASYAIAAYCWRRRTVAGAAFFAALALCRGLLTTGYILELLSPTLDGKIFWDDLQFYPSYIASLALLAFAVRHGEYRVRNPRLVWGGLLAVAALFSLATITNPVFHLLRTDASLVPGQPFSVLTYTFTRVYLLYVAYTLILYFASLLLLIVKWFRAPAPFRGQLGAIILGNSIPLAGAVLTRFGVIPAFDRDTTAFWFAISNAIVWWGMYHYRLFDLAPIARDKLIQQMNDIVVVVDAENRVVDMNRAAEQMRGAAASELIGKPVAEAFPLQLDLINRFEGMGEIDAEINPGGPNAARTLHLTVTPLTGRGDKLIGRLVVAHDITQLKETQTALDTERAKLEKTVARRTAALTKANQMLKEEVAEREEIARDLKDRDERLKRLSDAAFEGIAISENGVFVEINQQLADMLGVKPDEVIGKRIIEFVAPESREIVERRVRLNEEAAYDHIAMRKDGSTFPVEVRSRTLHLKGRKLRMTALRDMTEQHFAELSVRLSEERFRLILDNMPILLDAFDGNNRIIVWNKACEEATGYSAEEMLGNPNAMEILYPDPAYREFVWKSAMDPNSTDTTFDLTTKSGEKRTIMWFETFRQVDIPGWASWGLGLDVTETRRAEAAERASRALSDALADTALALSSNLELDVVLDRVLANVGKSVEHDAADIMLIDEGKARVVRSMANGMDIKTEGMVYPVKNFPLMAKLVKSNLPLIVEDTHKEPLWKQVPENAWIRSMLAAPVRRQGKVIGVINLLKREPHAFGDEQARQLVAFADQAAVAIHNAQLYRTERENRELAEALRDSTAALSSKLSQEEVLDSILDNLERVLPHDHANVMLLEDGVVRMVGKRGYSHEQAEVMEKMRFPIEERPNFEKMLETLQPVVVPDTNKNPDWIRNPKLEIVQSYVGAPIRIGKKVIGFLNVTSMTPNFFDKSVTERLTAFADQAAIAIHNAQLYRTERENRELAEALRDSTAALSSKLSLDEVLDSVFDNLNRVLPHDVANVMLLEDGVVWAVGKRGYTREQDDFLEKMPFPIEDRPNLVKMCKTLKPVVVTDTTSNPNWIQHPAFETLRSYVGAPIRVGKKVIGFLNLQSKTPSFFDESVTGRLTAFADQAAIAIHNAQLYRTERENRELAEALRDSTAALSSNLSLDEVLKSILDNLERVLPHAAANIMLIEGGTARVVGKRGYTRFNLDETLEAMRIPIESRHMFAAMYHKLKPAFVSDTRTDPQWVAVSGFEWQLSYVGVPIKVGNEVLGFLNLDGSEPGFFDESVIERLTTFADQAAIAIRNAQLYETERANRELAEALRDSIAALSSKLSLDEVLNSILDNLERVLPHTAANIMLVDGEIARVVGRRGYTQFGLDDVMTRARRSIKEMPNLATMMETHEPVIIPDTWKFSGWNKAPGFDWLRSYASAPIIVGDAVIGFLNLDGDRVGFFNESVIERLKAFASQAAIAIYNAQLYRTERENRELAEALRDTTAALNSKLSQEEVLNSIFENIGRVLPHDAANVMMIEGGVARIVGKRGYTRWNMDERLEKARYIISERAQLQQMLTTLKPVVITDTSKAPTWEIGGFIHWIRSYAGAPIRVGDEVIGFLNLDSAETGFFDESSIERLTAFADQAAVALHNARLYETERRERILAQMFQQLTEGVQGATSPSNILTIVLQALANLVPYRRAVIGLLEETGMRVEAEEGVDDHSGLMGKLYLFKDNPHLLQILSKGQPALFRPNDMPDTWDSLPGIDERASIWVAMPLTTWDVTTGLLCLTLADAATSNEDIIASVATFSQRARLALENSRLLIELLQSKGDLREAQSYLVRSAELAIAGEIATGVAHQISNPLTSVMAHAHLLLQKVGPDDPLYIYGKAIKDATDRAATVVQRMLDFARAREMDMQPVDLNASLNTAASLVEPQITASARLILNLEPNLPRVIGSREHLEDVWINLLINARDALKQQTDGVITLTSTLDRVDDKSIIIQFQDNGPGIPLDAQGRIFSSFFTTKEEGVGLGLAICYDIINQHHGSIHVESREGSGAKFIVRLPVGAAAGES